MTSSVEPEPEIVGHCIDAMVSLESDMLDCVVGDVQAEPATMDSSGVTAPGKHLSNTTKTRYSHVPGWRIVATEAQNL